MSPVRLNVPSDLITDTRLDQNPPDPARARGRLIVIKGTLTCLATDSATSTYLACQVPADAILDSNTAFFAAGWGFATFQLGGRSTPTVLLNAAKASPMAPVVKGGAMHGLPLWQQLGLAAAPEVNLIDLIVTGPAAATGAGTCPFEVWYTHHS